MPKKINDEYLKGGGECIITDVCKDSKQFRNIFVLRSPEVLIQLKLYYETRIGDKTGKI